MKLYIDLYLLYTYRILTINIKAIYLYKVIIVGQILVTIIMGLELRNKDQTLTTKLDDLSLLLFPKMNKNNSICVPMDLSLVRKDV